MAAELFLLPFRPALDANGIVVPGAQLFFYATGTLTPRAVYSDSGLTTPLTNPVVANAAGIWPNIYLDEDLIYRVILKDEDGTTLHDTDPYLAGVVDGLTDELSDLASSIAEDSATAAEAAESAEAFALMMQLAAFGIYYDTLAEGAAAVDEDEAFLVLEDGAVTLAQRVGGVGVAQAEFATLSMLEGLGATGLGNITLTVPTDIATLQEALEYVDAARITGPITIQLPAAQETAAVTIDIGGLTLTNPRMDQVTIKGAAGYATLSDASSMTGVEADDLNVMRAAMPTVILIDGDDSVASATNLAAGLESLAGLSFENLGIRDRARYGVASGFVRQHVNARPGGRLGLKNVISLMSVWSVFTYAGVISLTGTNLLGSNKSGAPLGTISGRIELAGTTTLYQPDVTTTADGPKYMVSLDGPAAYMEQDALSTLNLDGRSLYGFYQQNGARAHLYGTVNFDKVTLPITLLDGSEMVLTGAVTITDCDPTKTNLIGGAAQTFEPGNTPALGALIHVGQNAHFTHNGITMSDVEGVNALRILGGQMNSFNPIEVSDYGFSSYFANINHSWANTGDLQAASPKGSNSAFGSQILVNEAGEITLYSDPTANGLTASPTAITSIANRWIIRKQAALALAAVAAPAVTYAVTYAAPAGGATVDAEARAALAQLAADTAELAADNAAERTAINALIARLQTAGILS